MGWLLELFELERLLFSVLGTWAAPGVAASSAAETGSFCDKARGVRGGVAFEPSVSTCFSLFEGSSTGDEGRAGLELGLVGLEMCADTTGVETTGSDVLEGRVELRRRTGEADMLFS